jgi:RNA polymerase sigma factor (TIGR02999 family)
MDPTDRATELLQAWGAGNAGALEELIPLIDRELRMLAHAYISRSRPDHPLQTTALINEALMRLIGGSAIEWQSRRHFFAIAARVMRRIVIEHARESARKSATEHIPAVSTPAWS